MPNEIVCVCLCVRMDTRATLFSYTITRLCVVVSVRSINIKQQRLPGDSLFVSLPVLCFGCEMIITLTCSLLCEIISFIHSLSLNLLQHGWAPSPWGWSSSALPSSASSPTSSAAELRQWAAPLSAWSAYWPVLLSRKKNKLFDMKMTSCHRCIQFNCYVVCKVVGVVSNFSAKLKISVSQQIDRTLHIHAYWIMIGCLTWMDICLGVCFFLKPDNFLE